MTEAKAVKPRRKNFKWEQDMIQNLIDCTLNYKSCMLYKNLDFDADKVGLYREVRMAMAELYKDDEQYFGSVIVDIEKEKESKELIKRGTKRIQEKLKEIRQHFSKAVVSGSRSGSGKIVFEFYDQLILLWGGSANIEPLEFGVKGDDFIVEDSNNIESYDEETVLSSEVSPNYSMESTSRSSTSGESNDDLFITPKPNKRKHSSNSVESNESEDACPPNKKRDSCIPQLIDNKRKNLERNLSAAQRDQLLFKEARDDSQFRKDMADAMRESTKCFTESINAVSKSMTDLGSGISRSIEMMAQAMLMQTQQNQNQFYQHLPNNLYSNMLNSNRFPPHNTMGGENSEDN